MNYRLIVVLSLVGIFSSCSGYKKSAADGAPPSPPPAPAKKNDPTKKPDKPSQNNPDKPSKPSKPTKPPVDNRPLVSFVQTRVVTDHRNEAHIELQLSEPAKVPVIVEVYLKNGSALYHRDFTGFKLQYASVKAETRQILIFAPKRRRLSLPAIGVRNTVNCDTDFFVKINKNSDTARVEGDVARISIPCK